MQDNFFIVETVEWQYNLINQQAMRQNKSKL